MQCSVCHRRINKPAALANGLPVGPKCAEKLMLVKPKEKTMRIQYLGKSASRRMKAFWMAQMDLFGESI